MNPVAPSVRFAGVKRINFTPKSDPINPEKATELTLALDGLDADRFAEFCTNEQDNIVKCRINPENKGNYNADTFLLEGMSGKKLAPFADERADLTELILKADVDKSTRRRFRKALDYQFDAGRMTAAIDAQIKQETATLYARSYQKLNTIVLGQEPALADLAIGGAEAYSKHEFSDPRPPVRGLIHGPAGVGKTEALVRLAEFQNRELIMIQGSELSHEYDLAKIRGGGPGYVGSDDRCLLDYIAEKQEAAVKARKPGPIVCFDEGEKASKFAQDFFATILEKGRITTAKGRVVKFNNTDLFVTAYRPDELSPKLKKEFNVKSEFTTIQDPVVIKELVQRQIDDSQDMLKKRLKVDLTVDPALKALLDRDAVKETPGKGVRAIYQVVREQLFQPLAELISGHAGHTPIQVEATVQPVMRIKK